MMQTIPFEGKYTKATVMIGEIEANLTAKIIMLVNDPAFCKRIALMPDCHDGKGAAIGFTMELGDNVIPNVVGVDKDCGIIGCEVDTEYFDDIHLIKEEFDRLVRVAIPMGTRVHKSPVFSMKTRFSYADVQNQMAKFSVAFNARYGTNFMPPEVSPQQFSNWCNRVGCDPGYAECSVGTMGGGNHFIEIGRSQNTGKPWIFIHSGSRNLGKCSAEYWQGIAVKRLGERRKQFEVAVRNELMELPPQQRQTALKTLRLQYNSGVTRTLEPLYDKDMYDYLIDSIFAYHYAMVNRYTMLDAIMKIIGDPAVTNIINTVHNYVDHTDFIIRKGAVGAREGELFILPFNLEDGTLICKGKGNPDWNFSAPHGAGRIYSRTDAKAKLSVAPVRERLERKGIYSSQLPLDELPEAYKPAKLIEDAIAPTASIIDRIIPMINFKTKK